ncbi:MAG TPA: FecR domain-containing protein [Candidatus Limnocylindrales bacterium]|nr:FecR domain-containing protein [Candidatus Limnocylindrales bacterium]
MFKHLSWTFCVVVCFSISLAVPTYTQSRESNEPQLVQVIYAQGVVKYSEGQNGKVSLNTEWMPASAGLEVEEGYTIATEEGRAQVEFEDRSVVYLAERSVLQFKKLRATEDTTRSQLYLLTGTATVFHASYGQDDMSVETPTAKLRSKDAFSARIESTLNGTVFQAVDETLPVEKWFPGQTIHLKPGESVVIVGGEKLPLNDVPQISGGDAWDKWVNGQRLERQANLQKGMAESGLEKPAPGLAEMAKNGKFFDCPPYGKCWEPTQGGEAEAEKPAQMQRRDFVINRTLLHRCPMEVWMYSVGRPSRPGLLNANEPEQTFRLSGFSIPGDPLSYFNGRGDLWETCYGGTWVMYPCRWNGMGGCHHHHWVWVVGPPRRKPPVHIVHVPRGIGIIPRHPLDQKGKPPINAKNGILVLAPGKNGVQGRIEPPPGKGLHFGGNVLKPFPQGQVLTAGVAKATPPIIHGRMTDLTWGFWGPRVEIKAPAKDSKPILYDYKTSSFVVTGARGQNAHGAGAGGENIVLAHVGSHGASGGVTGHGSGSWSGSSGGGYGSGHGGSYSGGGGGGGHSGAGGYSGGGGGGSSHSGGGGGGSSGGGGGGSSGGSASSSGGGSSHVH